MTSVRTFFFSFQGLERVHYYYWGFFTKGPFAGSTIVRRFMNVMAITCMLFFLSFADYTGLPLSVSKWSHYRPF